MIPILLHSISAFIDAISFEFEVTSNINDKVWIC